MTLQSLTLLEIIFVVIIVMLVMVGVLFWFKMGKVSRFFAGLSMWAGAGSIFMGLWPTGETQIWKVQGKGRALRFGSKGFVFIPDLLRNPDMKKKEGEPEGKEKTEDDGTQTQSEYNQLIRTPAYLQGRRLFTGTMSANLAATPALLEALANASWKGAKELLDNIKSLGEDVKDVYIVSPWTLDKLSEYVNISFTQHDIDESYDEGYQKGMSASLGYNKIFLLLVFAALAVILGVVWLMGRAPAA